MPKIIGQYANKRNVNLVLEKLKQQGVSEIEVTPAKSGQHKMSGELMEGSVIGAVAGAAWGIFLGIVVGLGGFTTAAGGWDVFVSSIAIGALTGGILGSLFLVLAIKAGFWAQRNYVPIGRTDPDKLLVTVEARQNNVPDVRKIMREASPQELRATDNHQ